MSRSSSEKPSVRWLPRGGAAIAMCVSVSAFVGAVVYSHYAQVRDKAEMRKGVLRDRERLKLLKKKQRMLQKQQQQEQQQHAAGQE